MISWPVEVADSKYLRWYNALIDKAQNRTVEGYVETHHIIPRSFGGNSSKANLVELTAREHYIAHALLWKMKFPGAYGSKMAFAFNTFINKMVTEVRGVHHTYTISSRVYETFRKQYSEILKEKWAREGANFKGRKHTEEAKRIIGEKSKLKTFKRGPEHPNWGKKRNISADSLARQIASHKSLWADPEWKDKVLEKRKQANQRPEVIAKRKTAADARVGVKRDPASIEKTAAAKRGKTWEELYTPEQIARLHEGRKNRVLSDEAKEKMRLGRLKGISLPKKKKPCPHCGKLCAGNMLAKWHGDNCKLKIDQK